MFSIAIDGPSGVGKSTVVVKLAKKYGMKLFDSGAFYRAFVIKAYKSGVSYEEDDKLLKIVESTEISIKHIDGEQHTILDGKDITKFLKDEWVDKIVAKYANNPIVRLGIDKYQKKLDLSEGYILEGRDTTTFVLPDAKLKFFIDASVDVRAKRRYEQYKQKGEVVEFDDILLSIKERDKLDYERKVAPLRIADDAVYIKTDNLTLDETVDLMSKIIDNKIKELKP